MTPNERNRIMAAALGKSAAPFPTTTMFVVEDPSKFGPGHVVIADGSKRRMLITSIVTGFAQCIWFSIISDPNGVEYHKMPHFEIVHTSMLTLDASQDWKN